MKNILIISALVFGLGVTCARADEKKSAKPDERVQSTKIQPDNSKDANRTMKITDEKDDETRRQLFLEELHKLYKANFL